MKSFSFILLILANLSNWVIAQNDTLYYFDFEEIKSDVDPRTRVKLIRNNMGRFTEIRPLLPAGGLVSYGSPYSDILIGHGDYPVGKHFLYHSPSWYHTRYEGRVFSHVELELPEPLTVGKFYKISFLTGNMKSHRYKPAHYGVKFSETRIIKLRPGKLLSAPDIFFDFKNDEMLVPVNAIFYAPHDISYIYFGCFEEDSMLIPKTFTPIKSVYNSVSYSDTASHVHITKPTRVILDNIHIREMEKVESVFRDIYFDVDKDEIRNREDIKLIMQLADYLLIHPETYILIQGFTDEKGTLIHNLDLSERRAGSIRKMLVEKGIPEDRIVTFGKGIYRNGSAVVDMKYSRKVSFGLFR